MDGDSTKLDLLIDSLQRFQVIVDFYQFSFDQSFFEVIVFFHQHL